MLLDGNMQGANKKYTEAIEITTDMIQKLLVELKCLRIEYIVAPYEADAQLAYLFKIRQIDLVVTEDSDLLLFGASKVFFKMNTQG
jgi:exonuclease-1